ncbi:MAG: NPCBM/NEW2 domain-containing protein [Opitutae bacterium]
MRLNQFFLSFLASLSCLSSSYGNPSRLGLPEELEATLFSSKELTPCVACLSVAPTGEVYAGIDQIGSLGKGAGHGRIIRLIDKDNDGVSDSHTVYAEIDNPRGMISVGDKLYVLHTKWADEKNFDGMFLSVLEDRDGDGKADGPPKHLVKEISTRKYNQSRGVDHTTNGIRMGIDGWIYVAVGDFGFVNATGTDGTKLTMYGGGIIRVRPDGTELEAFAHGLRNIYDVAIDPYMNVFTRGNTNDGGGWNMRFIHEVQTGQYGYPTLFKRYTSEIIPALVDVGGGSGTGAMYFDEPGWPKKYTGVPMMCDWGRGHLFIHRVSPDGPTFTQQQEDFIKCGRITDVDCDGSGQLFIGSWGSSGFKGGTDGHISRVVPKGWKYQGFPNLKKRNTVDLANLLSSPSAKTQLHAQQEILRRGGKGKEVLDIALDSTQAAKSRIAAIYTIKQLLGAKSHSHLARLANDTTVAEHAIRALSDRKTQLKKVPVEIFTTALKNKNPRVQVAAAVGLGRIGNKKAANVLLSVANPPVADSLPTRNSVIEKEASKKSDYQSPIIDGKKVHEFDIDITGWKELHLTLGDGGNGTGSDHGSWFDPILVKKDGSTVTLTDLKWSKVTQGWGKTRIGFSATGTKLARKDGQPMKIGIGTHSIGSIIYKKLPAGTVRFKSTVGLASTDHGGKVRFYVSKDPVKKLKGSGKPKSPEGPHATPNSAVVLPHIARKALVDMNAGEACIGAIGSVTQEGALMALNYMHDRDTVDHLIEEFSKFKDSVVKQRVAKTLIRLANREKVYDGETWWSTRPDTRGPYYYPTAWEKTEKICKVLISAAKNGSAELRYVISELAKKDRVELPGLPKIEESQVVARNEPKVNLKKIMDKQGQVGEMSIEDVTIALGNTKGNINNGRDLFAKQGCVACHALNKDEVQKGPYLGQIGGIMDAERIAMSILRPEQEISQGFKTVSITTKKGGAHVGFVTNRLSDQIEMRDIAGTVTTLKTSEIASETLLPISMMPAGLANGMSMNDFASLVHFLAKQKN